MKKYIFILAVVLFAPSCNKNKECDAAKPFMQDIYNTISGTSSFYLDFPIHQYSFRSATNLKICSIGYQSPHSGLNHKIEIIEEASGTAVYNGSHTFSTATTSYVVIDPVSISANKTYIVRRTCVGHTLISQTIGMVKAAASPPTPSAPTLLSSISIFNCKYANDVSGLSGTSGLESYIPFVDLKFIQQ